jgi:hypothetical protein
VAIARAFAFQQFLRAQFGKLVAVPVWSDATKFVSAAGTTLTVSELTDRAFVASDSVTTRYGIVWESPTKWEAFEIIANNHPTPTLTIAEALTVAFTAGLARVLPLVVCRQLTASEIQFASDWHGAAPLEFVEDKAYTLASIPFAFSFYTYRGRPLFGFVADWSSAPSLVQEIPTDTLEGWGRDAYRQTATLPKQRLARTVSQWTRRERAKLMKFFGDARGRLGSFWLPAEQAELELFANVANGDSAIKVTPCGYATDLFVGNSMRRVLLIEQAGNFYVRKVIAAIEQSDHEFLSLESTLPALGAATTRVSFLRLVRFDQDELGWELLDDEHADAAARFREVGDAEHASAIAAAGSALDGTRDADGNYLP